MGCFKFCIVAFSALAFFSGSAFAAVNVLLAPVGDGPPQAGVVRVSAFFMNQGGEAAPLDVPHAIPCRLELDGSAYNGTMEPIATEVDVPSSLPPGGFYRRDYSIRVPQGRSGLARIAAPGLGAPEILLAVASDDGQGREPRVPEDGGQQPIRPEERGTELKNPGKGNSTGQEDAPLSYVISNLSTYKPMYFIYGANPAEAKFQLSFKYRLFNPEGDWAERLSWLSGFHIAYTQTSWWDMDAMSKPFKDSSYMPEFFWQTEDLGFAHPDWIESLGVRTGIQHESNGKAGDDSRSLNIAYVEPLLEFPLPWDLHLTVAPKVWTYIMDLSDNADIARYRGYFDLRMTLGQDDGLQLTTNLRKGTDEGKGSIQLDLTYPLARLTDNNLGLYLQAQFFDGYAESLIDYEEAHTSFYLGVAVSRW